MKASDYDISKIKKYLQVPPPSKTRSTLAGSIFLISLLGLMIMFISPINMPIILFILFLIVVITVWAIVLMFGIYRWQKQYVFFLSVFLSASTLVLYIGYLKIQYAMLNGDSPLFLIISAAVYVLILIYVFCIRTRALKKGAIYKKRINLGRIGSFSSGIAASGLLLGKALSRMGGNYLSIAAAYGFLILSYLFFIGGMIGIHRYYLIKKYPEYVTMFESPKKLQQR
jgi:hypothetical protein